MLDGERRDDFSFESPYQCERPSEGDSFHFGPNEVMLRLCFALPGLL